MMCIGGGASPGALADPCASARPMKYLGSARRMVCCESLPEIDAADFRPREFLRQPDFDRSARSIHFAPDEIKARGQLVPLAQLYLLHHLLFNSQNQASTKIFVDVYEALRV
jgi:hypothetical protein